MHVVTDPFNPPLDILTRGCSVTIGNFDGVHMGHQRLISRTISLARAEGLPSVVITFDPHPLTVVLGKQAPPMLMTLQQKLGCLADLGIDLTLVLPFTQAIADLSPENFVRDVLARSLHTRYLTVGHDYAFGKGRRGNAALLSELGKEFGFAVEEIPAVYIDDVIVSSTCIRTMLLAGNTDEARAFLGRPYSVEGVIEHGMNRGGKLLGFPTANLQLQDNLLLPKSGVYAVLAQVSPKRHALPGVCTGSGALYLKGVANVGTNPTFGQEKLRVETHLLNFQSDIYGLPFRVHFIHRLRDERKFLNVTELIEQIRRDAVKAKDILHFDGAFSLSEAASQ